MYTMIQVHQVVVVVVKMYQGIGEPGYRCVHQYTTQTQYSTGVIHTYYVPWYYVRTTYYVLRTTYYVLQL